MTVTHTIGVFVLGFVTLLLSQYILPEDLYPWLNLVSGLLVVSVGAAVLRSRAPAQPHAHSITITTTTTTTITTTTDLDTGAACSRWAPRPGLIPCPSALVVLLGAIAQHQVALGIVLIIAFSLGLAATLTVPRTGWWSTRRGSPAGSRPGPPGHRAAGGVGACDRRGRAAC